MATAMPQGAVHAGRGRVWWLPSARAAPRGALAAIALFAVYVTVIVLASGAAHLRYQLALDWPWVAAIVAGFGLQVAFLLTLREGQRARLAAAAAGTGAGASVVGMLACCAHHLAEVAPLVGVNLVTTFLASYRAPIMAIGIAVNACVIAVTLRQIRRLDAHGPPAGPPAGREGAPATGEEPTAGRRWTAPWCG